MRKVFTLARQIQNLLGADLKVLIVDDSQIMRKIIRTNLHKLGVTNVLECSDGAMAYKTILANQSVKLLFTDLNMPNLNGTDLIRRVRSIPKLKNLVIVVISDQLNATQAVLEQYNIRGSIPKPFNIVNFNTTVIPIIEDLSKAESDNNTNNNSKLALSDFKDMIKRDKPDLKIDEQGLSMSFATCTIEVSLDSLFEAGELKTKSK